MVMVFLFRGPRFYIDTENYICIDTFKEENKLSKETKRANGSRVGGKLLGI